jgi:ATP-binding cassette subfamily C protein
MLLINIQLLKLAKHSAGWIVAKIIIKLLLLLSVMFVYRAISSVQGQLYTSELTVQILLQAVVAVTYIAIIRLIGNLIDGELSYRCSASTRLSLRHRIYTKMLELEAGYAERMGTSNAVTACVDGIESLETYFSDYLPVLIYCLIAPFLLFGRVFKINETAAWILFIAALIVLPLNQLFKKIVQMLSGEYWKNFTKLNAFFLESLEGLYTFKLFNVDQSRSYELQNRSWTFRNTIMKTMRVNFNAAILSETIIYGSMAAAIIIASKAFSTGTIQFGQAIYLLLLADTFFTPVRALMRTGHAAMNGVAAAENVFSLLDLKPAHKQKSYEVAAVRQEEKGFFVDNVTFGYDEGFPVIHNVTMNVLPNKITAIVGQSGCGKSTIANLLMRFYDISSGEIRLNGRDISTMPTEELRKKVGIVPQNTYIFSGTIEDNLRMACPDATEEQMMKVCQMVRLDKYLASQPIGLKTDVGEAGCKLSGGQRQKLGIGRALLAGAEIYIFDEATSNVDVESEDDIWDCISTLTEKNTLVIIAHRLSTIKRADSIYVMQHGRIAESGTHNALLENRSLYCHLVTEQNILEGYNRGGNVNACC